MPLVPKHNVLLVWNSGHNVFFSGVLITVFFLDVRYSCLVLNSKSTSYRFCIDSRKT